METIFIIFITIIISIVVTTHINGVNHNSKSSLFKAATNLNGCSSQETGKFKLFVQPITGAAYVLYNVDSTKYSYINENTIAIVEIQSAGAVAKFKSIDYYTYPTPTIAGADLIADIVGTKTKHLEFDEAGTKLSDKSIFYETGQEPSEKYEKQLVNIAADGGTVESIQSTCTHVDYATMTSPSITTITSFLTSDYASPYVISGDRESTLTYTGIKDKRMTKVDGSKYTTFYTKDNEMCSISYDGEMTYTLYYSKYAAVPVFTPVAGATNIISINEATAATGATPYLSYSSECKGDEGSKKCIKSPEDTTSTMKYTMVVSNKSPYPLFIFKNKINFGSNTTNIDIKMEPGAIDEFTKTWAGCVSGIQKINSIGLYKYNIIIIFIISLIYIL